jgi:NADPH:quinone reductase
MRAAVCESLTGEEGVAVREFPAPTVGPRSVRVAVRAAAVNFPDGLMVRGRYQMRPDPPFVVGADCAGDIVAVGTEVDRFAVGDRVHGVTFGAFATEAVLSVDAMIHRMPDEMTYVDGAAFNITYGTAYHGLVCRAQLLADETVLILGAAGGCGSAAIQVAKAAGATVIAVAGGVEKCAAALSLGADHVIDHREVESASKAAKDLTAGRGVDVVFDTVGGGDAREQLRSLAFYGRLLVVGFASGQIPTVGLNQTLLKDVAIVGFSWGASAARDPEHNRADYETLHEWYRQGLTTPRIHARLPLDDVREAMRIVNERQAIGKVVLEIEP